jgi:hypothetical protein
MNHIKGKELIKQVIANALNDTERMKCPVTKALMLALEEYVDMGCQLSKLPWFKGLNFEMLEES